MQVDPIDDCTFWYTQEYVPVTGPANWGTHIVTFRFPNCLSPSTTTLGSSNNPSSANQPVILTATVAPTSSSATGTATFNDGLTVLGTTVLNSSFAAIYTTSSLAAGAHSITAVYSGDANNASSASAILTQTVQDFALSFTPFVATVFPGTTATFTLTIAPQGGSFSAAISLSCSGLPPLSTCTFSPATVTPNAVTATAQLAISTTGPSAVLAPSNFRNRSKPLYGIWLLLPAIMFIALGRTNQSKLVTYISVSVLLCGCLTQVACGGGSSGSSGAGSSGSRGAGSSGTPAGPYTITVTATAGSTHHATTVTLKIS